MTEATSIPAALPRLHCRFTPQAWVSDYAIEVDSRGPREWDTSDTHLAEVLAWHASRGPASVEEFWREVYGSSYASDSLRDDPAAPDWVRQWDGPFEVDVTQLDDSGDQDAADAEEEDE